MDAYGLTICDLLDTSEDWLGDKSPHVNDLIYAAYSRVADEFLGHVVKHRADRFITTDYQIFTNYMDSSLWFEDANLNRWYEAWRAF
jgi:hypothetical protein